MCFCLCPLDTSPRIRTYTCDFPMMSLCIHSNSSRYVVVLIYVILCSAWNLDCKIFNWLNFPPLGKSFLPVLRYI